MNGCDVAALVVGAGPTGLTMASELRRHGMGCRIIDRLSQPSRVSKALGIQPRTLELFEKMGIVDAVLTRGVQVHTANIYGIGQRVSRLDLRCVPSRYPFLLSLPQWVTEEILGAHIRQQGIEVERGVSLISLRQVRSGVEVVLELADGRLEQVRTRWLIGCDGPHSTVRHHLGLAFAGSTFDQSFALADVRMNLSLPPHEAAFFWRGGDFIGCIPLPDNQYRLIVAYRPHAEPDGDVTLGELERALAACGWADTKVDDVVWSSRFVINQRKVAHYRQGSVFMAGDACHIHSPMGAQGMNTGIQDAFNLAWKLALVDSKKARPAVLDSYEAERERFGRHLLLGTNLVSRLALLSRSQAVRLRDHVIPFATGPQPVRTRTATLIAQLGVSYRRSPIVSEYRSKHIIERLGKRLRRTRVHHAGDRAPDMDVVLDGAPTRLHSLCLGTRHVLFFFAHRDSAERSLQGWRDTDALIKRQYGDLVDAFLILPRLPGPADTKSTRTIYDEHGEIYVTYGITGDGVVLVRPDGHIGFLCSPASSVRLRAYLDRLFSAAPRRWGQLQREVTRRARVAGRRARRSGPASPTSPSTSRTSPSLSR
jgi:2-polyprenyl-6-methoxyphenol hydroxylase-like FAD-dependent oxidoreductase